VAVAGPTPKGDAYDAQPAVIYCRRRAAYAPVAGQRILGAQISEGDDMRAKASAAAAALVISMTHAASAAVWGFGDSNLDNGWYMVAPYSGSNSFDVYLAQASTYGIGKMTNNPGPMSIEVLAGLLGVTAAPANQPNGTNYATSGAKNVDKNTPTNGGFPNAVPTTTQMKNFAAAKKIGLKDVFLIDSGGNDITHALTLAPTDRQTYLQAQASQLAKTINALQLRGATHLIIVNQPESFGTTDQRNARVFYDAALRKGLDTLGVTYAWGDKNRVRQDIVASPTTFNMLYTNNTAAHIACPQNAGFPSGWALLCSPNSPVITPTSFAQQTLFADDGHWASQGQRALGSYYFCLVKKYWPALVPTSPFPTQPRPPFACNVFSEFATAAPK
jgi:GDSL-like lipase/acylhydrolase family protein